MIDQFMYALKQLIPKKNELSDICVGTVRTINPLEIMIDNSFPIKEKFIILGAMVKETTIKIPLDHAFKHLHVVPQHETELGGGPAHKHVIKPFDTEEALPDIMLWRGLKVGDKVTMIRCFSGQRYYVMERQEGITNDPNK